MRRAVPLTVLILAGCASAPPGSDLPRGNEAARVTDAGGNALRIRPNEAAARVTISAPIADVWRVLPAVFDSLAIPVNTLDPAIHVFGNSGLSITKRLGKTSLAQFIDCGQTQGFPSAETYEINLAVMTQLHAGAEAGTTMLATSLNASARPMTFRGDYSRCSSKGELEKRIADRVRAEVARKK